MDDCKMTNCETSDSHTFEDNHMKEEPEPVVQGILKDAMSNIAFDSPNLLQSECYAGDDMSTTDSCMSLPASTILLTAKPFKSRIPIRRGGATTPSDYDRMSNHSGRSTPTFRNSLDPMSSSFTNGYVNINHEYKREDSLPSSFGVVPPSIAPKPAYIKGQLPRRFNKIPLKRETSLPPFSFGTTLSQSQSPQTGKDQTNVLKPVVKPNYVRSNSSLSMYEERKKSRDQHNQQLHKLGYMPALLNSSSRRGSIDNFYGGGGDIESASSTRCSTPNRLMGSLSKIPIWTGSQEKLNTLRQNPISPNSSLQKTPTSSRILPPTPNKVATNVSGNRIGGTVKGKRLNSKKWESCSNLEVRNYLDINIIIWIWK